jgi:hypothetical protein
MNKSLATIEQASWKEQNAIKNSGIGFIPNKLTNSVLRAAVDWKRFQSSTNATALYLAVVAMMGETPEVPYELD